jgi:hypothetical protein
MDSEVDGGAAVAALELGQSDSSPSGYIDRARKLVDLATRASSEETRSQFMLLAVLYRELAQRHARLLQRRVTRSTLSRPPRST